jgi:hypothetical protein
MDRVAVCAREVGRTPGHEGRRDRHGAYASRLYQPLPRQSQS